MPASLTRMYNREKTTLFLPYFRPEGLTSRCRSLDDPAVLRRVVQDATVLVVGKSPAILSSIAGAIRCIESRAKAVQVTHLSCFDTNDAATAANMLARAVASRERNILLLAEDYYGGAISASRVRALLEEGNWGDLAQLIPLSTLQYLIRLFVKKH